MNDAKSRCRKPAEHHQHLCSLKAHLSPGEIAPLLKDPRYVCRICGGRTHRGDNLCAPRRLRT